MVPGPLWWDNTQVKLGVVSSRHEPDWSSNDERNRVRLRPRNRALRSGRKHQVARLDGHDLKRVGKIDRQPLRCRRSSPVARDSARRTPRTPAGIVVFFSPIVEREGKPGAVPPMFDRVPEHDQTAEGRQGREDQGKCTRWSWFRAWLSIRSRKCAVGLLSLPKVPHQKYSGTSFLPRPSWESAFTGGGVHRGRGTGPGKMRGPVRVPPYTEKGLSRH